MPCFNVLLASTEDACKFCKITQDFDFDIDLGSGNRFVDAKSLLGIFTLDLSKPLTCSIHASEADSQQFANSIQQFFFK